MKFLLDQGLPRSTVGHLQAMGLEAEHVGNLGLATATDETILAEGRNREDVARIILQVVEATERDLTAGAAVTVTDRRLALRRLPLIAD